MKYLVLSILFVVAPFVGYSQTTLHFTYDDAGNRTSRTIVVRSLQAPDYDMNTSVDLYEDVKVRIKELSTDFLQVEILGLNNSASISIYDASGKAFLSCNTLETISSIDISALPRGIYVLRIDIDGDENTWKLIKK